MLRRAALFAIGLAFTPAALLAQGSEFTATYRLTSGSLPPEYAWSVTAVITQDGAVTVTDCKGYDTEGANCAISNGQTTPEAIAAIRKAVADSQLIEKPASLTDTPSVGGRTFSGSVTLDGAEVKLPDQPHADDAERVKSVMGAIAAAIPADLQTSLQKD